MTQTDFVDLVKRMRQAQKEYFRTRTTETLKIAKDFEMKVDDQIKEMKRNQIKLF